MQNVVGYIRVSTVRQEDEGASLEEQAHALRGYCDTKGMHLLSIEEDARSAAGAQGHLYRDGFQQAIRIAKENDAMILVPSVDRLARHLHARLTQRNALPELALGDRVAGHYLGQAFSGEIVALSGSAGHRHVEIKLDRPVDTVRFESFSNWRHRIRGTLGVDGRSHHKTSDGTPHLVIERSLS